MILARALFAAHATKITSAVMFVSVASPLRPAALPPEWQACISNTTMNAAAKAHCKDLMQQMVTSMTGAGGCSFVDIGCKVSQAAAGWFEELTKKIATAAASLLANAMTWWTHYNFLGSLTNPAITSIQSSLAWLGLVILVGSIIWQSTRLVITRKPSVLLGMGMGLWQYILWTGAAAFFITGIYSGSLALTSDILGDSLNKFADRIGSIITGNVGAIALVFFLAIILFVLSLIQWVLGFFRMASVLVLYCLIPLAASGAMNQSTKPWLEKLLPWLLSLLLYQPLAGIIMAMGMAFVGESQDVTGAIVGLAMLAVSIVAMPALMKFFSWGTGTIFAGSGGVASGGGGGGGGGGGALAAAGTGAMAMSAYMSSHGPAGSGSDGSGGGGSVVAANGGSAGGMVGGSGGGGGSPSSTGAANAGASVASATAGGAGDAGSSGPAGSSSSGNSSGGDGSSGEAGTAGAAGAAASAAATTAGGGATGGGSGTGGTVGAATGGGGATAAAPGAAGPTGAGSGGASSGSAAGGAAAAGIEAGRHAKRAVGAAGDAMTEGAPNE